MPFQIAQYSALTLPWACFLNLGQQVPGAVDQASLTGSRTATLHRPGQAGPAVGDDQERGAEAPLPSRAGTRPTRRWTLSSRAPGPGGEAFPRCRCPRPPGPVRPWSRHASGSGCRRGTGTRARSPSGQRFRTRRTRTWVASQIRLTVDRETRASGPRASARAASPVADRQAPDEARDDQGLQRVGLAHPRPEEAGGEGLLRAPELRPLQGDRSGGGPHGDWGGAIAGMPRARAPAR